MPRARLYLRISRDRDEKRVGVDRQRRECTELAANLGWPVEQIHEDNDRSAYNGKHRPDFEKLLADLHAGRVEALIAWDQDRLARDVRDWAEVRRACRQHNVRVAFVTEHGEVLVGTVSGGISTGMKAVMGEAESEQKSLRILAASRQRADEGLAAGQVRYGWAREVELNQHGKKVSWRDVEDPEAAAVVRECAQRVLAGDSLRVIANDLNARGVPTPAAYLAETESTGWLPVNIRVLLMRPSNVGLRVHQGKVYGPAQAPALLDQDTYDRVCSMFKDPRRRTTTDSRARHLLSGIATCGTCGAEVRAKGVRYVCEARGCTGRRKDWVDDLVTRIVVGRLSRPDALDLLVAPNDEAATEAAEEAAALRARLDLAADEYAAGSLDPDSYRRIRANIEPKLAAARERAAQSRPRATDTLVGLVAAKDAQRLWDDLPITARRQVVAELLAIAILPVGKAGRAHGWHGFDPDTVGIEWRQP